MLSSDFPPLTADMIIIALLISISLAFIYILHTTVSCKPNRELAHIFVAFDHFTELTMSSLVILFRLLFLQIVFFDTAIKEGKFIM